MKKLNAQGKREEFCGEKLLKKVKNWGN